MTNPTPLNDAALFRQRAYKEHGIPLTNNDSEILLKLARALPEAQAVDDDEAYKLGVEDGYSRGVQDADMRTFGDGEYVASVPTGGGCPDPQTMLAQMQERVGFYKDRYDQVMAADTASQASADVVRALEAVDADVRHHLRSDEIHTALIRPDAIRLVRDALRAAQSPGEREDAIWNDVERDALIAIIAGAQSLADSFHDQTLPAPQELRRAIPIATAILKRQSATGKGDE